MGSNITIFKELLKSSQMWDRSEKWWAKIGKWIFPNSESSQPPFTCWLIFSPCQRASAVRHGFPTKRWHNSFFLFYVKTGTAQYGASRFKCISMCSAQCLDSVVLKCVSHHIVTQFASPSAIVNPQGGAWPSCPRVVHTIILRNEYLQQFTSRTLRRSRRPTM